MELKCSFLLKNRIFFCGNFWKKNAEECSKIKGFQGFYCGENWILRDTVEGFFDEIEIKVRCKLKRDFFKMKIASDAIYHWWVVFAVLFTTDRSSVDVR